VKTFRANGKLLLTAEYSVLRGALALALPTTFGQTLEVAQSRSPGLVWRSLDLKGKPWFTGTFSQALEITGSSDVQTARTLQQILRTTRLLNPNFEHSQTIAQTKLEFNREWGLGSSSTLIALIAQWARVDALELFFKTLSGSGYDVACALAGRPILYQKVGQHGTYKVTSFAPAFRDHIHFVYLGKKQKSDREVVRFRSRDVSTAALRKISALTAQLAASASLSEFEQLLEQHEELTGAMIGLQPVQQRLFPDYPGCVKSLGAWGGDFVLVTRLTDSPKYFANRGYSTTLSWQEMIGE
jgi:mevalonate kinase